VNLVQPPDQKSRPLAERPGITGLSRWLPGHLQSLCPLPMLHEFDAIYGTNVAA
jgi:hypothetical protein